MSFTVVTYNVLASAYLRPEWYSLTPRELLKPRRRLAAVVGRLVELNADLLCLQEVEPALYAAARQRLEPLGYAGELAMKGQGRPDGCAAFWHRRALSAARGLRLAYQDGEGGGPPSGHIAQLLVLNSGDGFLGVANTHLKWHLPGTPVEQQTGARQVNQLLRERHALAPECSGWILCGDLNVTVESPVVAALREAGFEFSHAGLPEAATCNPHRRRKMIDYLFYDAALQAEPLPLPRIEDETPLPGPEQPSDHVPVVARFTWRDPG